MKYFFAALLLLCPAVGTAETSKLWGEAGEAWTPQSRLPDFSYAGYHSSRDPLPTLIPSANVKEFGAKGDGKTDDTNAFLSALESASKGAIFIPAGTYKLSEVVRISRRGQVLQGEGIDKTILFFPKPLEQMVGPGKSEAPSGSWSWDGGAIWFQGDNRGEFLADIVAPAKRGANTFRVSDTERFHPGQRVRLFMYNTDGNLGRALHAGRERASRLLDKKLLVDFSCTVVSVNPGSITVDRPVRVDVNPGWKASFETDAPTVEDVGIENLTIAFPMTRYAGHHDEPGYNAITFQSVSNGWVKNVRIVNADSGIILRSNSKFCTVQNVQLDTDKGRERAHVEGHHGIEVADLSQDNLFTEFRINTRFIHTMSLTSMACGNVFMKGSGTDLTFDHHRKAPYENLYTELNTGHGSDIWLSGGDEDAGPFSGARETFWNVKSELNQSIPNYAIQINWIGFTTNRKSDLNPSDNWIEVIKPDSLTPPNLFESQLARRRKKT